MYMNYKNSSGVKCGLIDSEQLVVRREGLSIYKPVAGPPLASRESWISLKVGVKLKRKLLDQNLCGNIIFAWFLFAAEDVIISFFTFFC